MKTVSLSGFNQYKSDETNKKIKVKTNAEMELTIDHAQRNLTLKKTIYVGDKK